MFEPIAKPSRYFENTYWLTTMDYAWQYFETVAWIQMRNTWREVNNQTPVVGLLLAGFGVQEFLPEAGVFQIASRRAV